MRLIILLIILYVAFTLFSCHIKKNIKEYGEDETFTDCLFLNEDGTIIETNNTGTMRKLSKKDVIIFDLRALLDFYTSVYNKSPDNSKDLMMYIERIDDEDAMIIYRIVYKFLKKNENKLLFVSDDSLISVYMGKIKENKLLLQKYHTVVQRVDYYPGSGLPFPGGLNPDEQPFKHNSCEFDPMHGLNFTDHRNRYLDHATNRYTTPDRFAEKFPWQSPYVHAGNNAVKYIDIRGDSVSFAGTIVYDNNNSTNYTTTTVNDLQSQTGLSLTTATSGQLHYEKDKNGNPIIATTTDANGNTVQVGSEKARNHLISLIDNQNTINVGITTILGSRRQGDDIWLSPNQINSFISGAVGLDNRTLGWGMTFLHESYHTSIGGGLSDSPFNPGPVVSNMNIIRSELNALGGNYGQRLNYYEIPINSTFYIPFCDSSKNLINIGAMPGGVPWQKFIHYKK